MHNEFWFGKIINEIHLMYSNLPRCFSVILLG